MRGLGGRWLPSSARISRLAVGGERVLAGEGETATEDTRTNVGVEGWRVYPPPRPKAVAHLWHTDELKTAAHDLVVQQGWLSAEFCKLLT